jgi:hypothetical protein
MAILIYLLAATLFLLILLSMLMLALVIRSRRDILYSRTRDDLAAIKEQIESPR